MTRSGPPIIIHSVPLQYNVIEGKKSLHQTRGLFFQSKRLVKQGGLNNIVNREAHAVGSLNPFLSKHGTLKPEHIEITPGAKSLRGDHFLIKLKGHSQPYKLVKQDNLYALQTVRYLDNKPHQVLTIRANDDNEFKQKLSWICTKPETQGKLEFRTSYLPLLNKTLFRPFGSGQYVHLNDQKVIGNYAIQEFHEVGYAGQPENYQSALGSADHHQINHYCPLNGYHGYSRKEGAPLDNKQVVDKFWTKLHAQTEFLSSSAVIDELLGNVVNMHFVGRTLSPTQRGHMIQKMREDYIYNLHGNGTKNGRGRDQSSDSHSSYGKRFEFGRNPLRGNRYIRFNKNGLPEYNTLPPGLEETLMMMYRPTADGGYVCKYDDDPEKFMTSLRDRLKIHETDRQYMMAHGRKALAIRVAFNQLNEEISKVKLNDPKASKEENQKQAEKWCDLSELKDSLFVGAGDLKSVLRKGNSGYVAMSKAVKEGGVFIPKDGAGGVETDLTPPTPQEFTEKLTKGLYDIAENYASYEDYFGWQFREKSGSEVFKDLKEKTFSRNIPRSVAAATTVMIFESTDKLSRRLKFIAESLGRDTNAHGYMKMFADKLTKGDLKGLQEIVNRYKSYALEGVSTENLFKRTKFQYVQGEGLMWEREVFPVPKHYYQGENNGFFNGNYPAGRMAVRGGEVLGRKFSGLMREFGKYMHKASEEMRSKNLTSAYETDTIKEMSGAMQKAAKEMSTKFISNYEWAFNAISDADMKIVYNDIYKEFYAYLQMMCNAAALLATCPDRNLGVAATKNPNRV